MIQIRSLYRVKKNLSLISLALALIFLLVLGGGQSARAATSNVLVLYDSSGTWGWIGDIYRQHLANLLSHFNVTMTVEKVENYQAGQIHANNATFYIGAVYDNPLPAAFINDFLNSTNTVCWLGYNLWQAAWNSGGWNPAFYQKFGVDFWDLDFSPWSVVNYKGQQLTRQTTEPEIGSLQQDPYFPNSIYSIVATAQYTDSTGQVHVAPYITHTGNLWYVADDPMSYVTRTDRFLAFADLLYDILGISYTQTYRAHVRIEDVAPDADPAQLTAIADYLYSQNVPFAVATIPEYRDPLGTYNGGVAVSLNMNQSQATAVANALQYMVTRGGKIVQHGTTHQYDKTKNCYTGVTGDDYEFYLVGKDPTTFVPIYQGPIPGDSTNWAKNLVTQGKNMLTNLKLAPVAWETPHYLASPADYAAFKSLYPLSMDRGCYFSTDTAGVSHPLNQMSPYVIQSDVYGIKRFPENLGYLSTGVTINNDPYGFTPEPAIMPADLLAGAQANLVVRDAWASFYYHPDLDLSYLQQTVTGIKALGYTFVPTPTNGAIN